MRHIAANNMGRHITEHIDDLAPALQNIDGKCLLGRGNITRHKKNRRLGACFFYVGLKKIQTYRSRLTTRGSGEGRAQDLREQLQDAFICPNVQDDQAVAAEEVRDAYPVD